MFPLFHSPYFGVAALSCGQYTDYTLSSFWDWLAIGLLCCSCIMNRKNWIIVSMWPLEIRLIHICIACAPYSFTVQILFTSLNADRAAFSCSFLTSHLHTSVIWIGWNSCRVGHTEGHNLNGQVLWCTMVDVVLLLCCCPRPNCCTMCNQIAPSQLASCTASPRQWRLVQALAQGPGEAGGSFLL